MAGRDNRGDYAVGYGKPPAQHRFRKGLSGNPKGRPRKAPKEPETPRFRDGRLESLLEEEAFRSLQLNENGKPVEMPAAQAVLRSILLDGVKGNRLAKKYAFETLRQEEREAQQRSIEHYNYFERKKAEGEAEIARCEAQGLPPPRLYPHPKDILLDEAKLEVHLLGPLTADRAIPFERGALVRDWMYARWVLEEKCGKVTLVERNGMRGPGWGILAAFIERGLPPSFRRDEWSAARFMVELQSLTKRRLAQRMKEMMAQLMTMPDSIEERLADRERSANVVGAVAMALEKVAADLAEEQGSADHTAARSAEVRRKKEGLVFRSLDDPVPTPPYDKAAARYAKPVALDQRLEGGGDRVGVLVRR